MEISSNLSVTVGICLPDHLLYLLFTEHLSEGGHHGPKLLTRNVPSKGKFVSSFFFLQNEENLLSIEHSRDTLINVQSIVIGAKTESMKCKIQSIKRKVYPSPFWSKTLKAAFTSSMEFSFSFIFLRIILRNSSNSILPKFVNIFKFLTKNSNDLTGPVFIRFCHHFLEIVL